MPVATGRIGVYPKGIIGVSTSPIGRYREFDMALNEVEAPAGSLVTWQMGVNIPRNYNQMVRTMLAGDFGWVWIQNDDHVFKPDLLMNLLDRNVDIVIPLCLMRQPPFVPVLHYGSDRGYGQTDARVFAGVTGLMDITGYTSGLGGVLIRREVCEKMPEPWFENGKVGAEGTGCDLWFCEKARQHGFALWLDMDNTMGHIFHAAVWPERTEGGQWTANVTTA